MVGASVVVASGAEVEIPKWPNSPNTLLYLNMFMNSAGGKEVSKNKKEHQSCLGIEHLGLTVPQRLAEFGDPLASRCFFARIEAGQARPTGSDGSSVPVDDNATRSPNQVN